MRASLFLVGVFATVILCGCTSDNGYQSPPPPPPVTVNPKPKPQTDVPNVAPHYVKLKYPITDANGKWTVRVGFYYGQGQSTAAQLADQAAEGYRKAGREAYVTDMGVNAILTVGSFTDPKDPRLIATWQQERDDYLRAHGGKESSFQQDMNRFFEGSRAVGDQPWPVDIERLQMRMKYTQGKITQAQWNKFNEDKMRGQNAPNGGK